MRNNITAFIISALIHSSLIGGAFYLSQKEVKKKKPKEKVTLTVTLFQKEVLEPVKPPVKEVSPPPSSPIVKQQKITLLKKVTPVIPRIRKELTKPLKKKQTVKPKKKTVVKKAIKKRVIKPKVIVKRNIPAKPRRIVTHKQKVRQQTISRPAKRTVIHKAVAKHITPHKNIRAKQAHKNTPIRKVTIARTIPKATTVRPIEKLPMPSVNNNNLRKQYKSRLQQMISLYSRKHYPMRAKRRGQQGRVTVGFTVMNNGVIKNIRILKGSNSRTLDAAAIQALKKSSGKLPFYNKMSKNNLNLDITLAYILR